MSPRPHPDSACCLSTIPPNSPNTKLLCNSFSCHLTWHVTMTQLCLAWRVPGLSHGDDAETSPMPKALGTAMVPVTTALCPRPPLSPGAQQPCQVKPPCTPNYETPSPPKDTGHS